MTEFMTNYFPVFPLALGAFFGWVADKKLDTEPDIGIPATFFSLMFTMWGIIEIILFHDFV
jgi:hypothetical protein